MNNIMLQGNKNVKPISYQTKAIEDIRHLIMNQIQYNPNASGEPYEILLQSTVASGKTIMGGRVMEEVVSSLSQGDERFGDHKVSFIWVSTADGALINQSKNSVERFTGNNLNVLDLQSAIKQQELKHGDVVFMGWDSINRADNIAHKDNETGNFSDLLKNTKTKIIMVIDEAHRDRDGARNKVAIELINPYIILNLTATPSSKNRRADIVRVNPQDVVNAGRIRKKIRLNADLLPALNDESFKARVLRSAIAKQAEIKRYAHDNGLQDYINQTPLIVVQISNDKGSSDKDSSDDTLELNKMLTLLGELGVREDNIAINMSNEKVLFQDIDTNNVDFLITKQAISTGWDCPRAQILVQFRDVKSVTFHLQTLGRVMRTLKGYHYGVDLLDNAYLYTDEKPGEVVFEIDADLAESTGLVDKEEIALKDGFKDKVGMFNIPMQKIVFEKLGEVDSERLWHDLSEAIDFDKLDADFTTDVLTNVIADGELNMADVLDSETGLPDITSVSTHKKNTEELKLNFIKGVGSHMTSYSILNMIRFVLKKHPLAATKGLSLDDFVYRLYANNEVYLDSVLSGVIRKFTEDQAEKQSKGTTFTIQEVVCRNKPVDPSDNNYSYERQERPDPKSKSEYPFTRFLSNSDNVIYWHFNKMTSEDFSIVYYADDDLSRRYPRHYFPDFFVIAKDPNVDGAKVLYILDVKSKHGDGNHEYTKEKYEVGKKFEIILNENNDTFSHVVFSMIRLTVKDQPTMLTGDSYVSDFTDAWVDFEKVLNGK